MPRKYTIQPGMRRTTLTHEQVRMIVLIYYTDLYQRRELGLTRCTTGLRPRLAKQFGASIETIKKIIGMPHNGSRKRRKRFPGIALSNIQNSARKRVRQRNGDNQCGI
jgi:hypothetical protein